MKDIQELMMAMDTDLAREQAALDLSSEEKEELVSLINNIDIDEENIDVKCADTCGTPCPTTPCPTDACTPQTVCCVVAFPSELEVVSPYDVKAAVVPKDLSVDCDSKCSVQIGNCTVILDKAKISGCAQVFLSLAVKDRCENISYVCCCDCVSLNKNILCCGLPEEDTIKFEVSDLTAVDNGLACEGDKQIWALKGELKFTCEEC